MVIFEPMMSSSPPISSAVTESTQTARHGVVRIPHARWFKTSQAPLKHGISERKSNRKERQISWQLPLLLAYKYMAVGRGKALGRSPFHSAVRLPRYPHTQQGCPFHLPKQLPHRLSAAPSESQERSSWWTPSSLHAGVPVKVSSASWRSYDSLPLFIFSTRSAMTKSSSATWSRPHAQLHSLELVGMRCFKGPMPDLSYKPDREEHCSQEQELSPPTCQNMPKILLAALHACV
jgi:hypothetical protein